MCDDKSLFNKCKFFYNYKCTDSLRMQMQFLNDK